MPDLEFKASPKLSPTILNGSSRSQHNYHYAIACGCFTQASTITTRAVKIGRLARPDPTHHELAT